MNTKALLSLDELVNKPEIVLKKLEMYGELVLIRENKPYCVVSRVKDEEDEENTEYTDAFSSSASADSSRSTPSAFPETPKSAPVVTENGWFGNYFNNTSSEPPKPVFELQPRSESEQSPQETEKQEEEPPVTEEMPEEEPEIPEETPVSEPPKPVFDYVPYEQLKARQVNLWDAMAQVLSEYPTHVMHAVDLARIINERGLYKTKDGKPVTPIQIRARVEHRPQQFAALGGNMIKLLTI